MKTKIKMPAKAMRTRYSGEFKQQALARAAQDGVAAAVKDLGLPETISTLGVPRRGWKGRPARSSACCDLSTLG